MSLIVDQQYISLIEDIIVNGDRKDDRTGVGTKALWCRMARFDLGKGEFPIISSKRVFWKLAVREMLWFLSGDTNIRTLLQQNVHIWSQWPHALYVKETGENISLADFERRVLDDEWFSIKWGTIRKGYGYQWRNWVGPDGKIYDQIWDVIKALKNNPNSRRILFHGWNVADVPEMALPPCHTLYQYQVTSDGKLNSVLFCRKQ